MQDEKLTPRKIQARNTREKIYRTAVNLITERGFDKITVDEICKAAGVAKGSFYHYFKSKDDIVIEAYNVLDRYFMEEVVNELTQDSCLEKLKVYLTHMAKHADDHGIDFVKQFYKSQIFTHANFVVSSERGFYKILYRIIDNGQNNGEFRKDLSSDELSMGLMVVVRGILYDWCLHDGNYNIIEFTNRYFEVYLQSIIDKPSSKN